MDAELFRHASEWTFPEVELDLNTSLKDELDTLENDGDQEAYSKHELAVIEAKKELEAQKQENAFLREEMEGLRVSIQSQAEIMNKLLTKLKTPLTMIDEEIVELIQDIIKKLTKRIICKEITAEANVIVQMINEVRSVVDSKHGLLAIHLSNHDYENLATLKTDLSGIAVVDNNLNTGDIILESNFGEVRGILNERIEQLLRIDHD